MDATRSWREAVGAAEAQERRRDRAIATRDTARGSLTAAQQHRDHATELLRQAEAASAARRSDIDVADLRRTESLHGRRRARMLATVSGLDLTLVDLHAYWSAAAVSPCPTPWWLLAGIGKVESRHGTYQGASVGIDGRTDKKILGIPLDGRPGVAAIGDTDGGLLDGDPGVDRAVGPMQFIPSTWARWQGDGNGDGTNDPHNLYDAAAAAGRYLCFGRPTLTDDGLRRAALLSYNRSVPYGNKVLAEGSRYFSALSLPELPPATTPAVTPVG